VKDYRPLTRGATLWVRSVAGARDLLKVIRASSGVKKNQTKVCQGDEFGSIRVVVQAVGFQLFGS
jgi:hypothetical protein